MIWIKVCMILPNITNTYDDRHCLLTIAVIYLKKK